MKKVFSIVFTAVLMLVFTVSASAQTYSREYPRCGNSGSPLWIHCEIQNMGEYVILLDPDTNIDAFGFDTPEKGYNLINNTGSVIKGRAYALNGSSTAYLVQFPSYYRIQMRTGYSSNGQQTVYEDHKITAIYGTTMNLIDYTGNRGNDYFKGFSVDMREFLVVILIVGIVLILIYRVLRRSYRGRI